MWFEDGEIRASGHFKLTSSGYGELPKVGLSPGAVSYSEIPNNSNLSPDAQARLDRFYKASQALQDYVQNMGASERRSVRAYMHGWSPWSQFKERIKDALETPYTRAKRIEQSHMTPGERFQSFSPAKRWFLTACGEMSLFWGEVWAAGKRAHDLSPLVQIWRLGWGQFADDISAPWKDWKKHRDT